VNPLRTVAIVMGRQPWLPKFGKVIVGLDKGIQRLTNGHMTLLSSCGLTGLMLTVKGRKTGIERETPLLYTPHPDGPLIAGSNWGQEKPPAWVANLRAAQTAQVMANGVRTSVRARELEGTEREEKLAEMVKVWPNYRIYVEKAAPRVIPIFQLEPVLGA